MTKESRSHSSDVESFTRQGVVFKRDDCVLLKSEDDKKPFIGRILQIDASRNAVMCKVAWFYRPEECEGGRQVFHGQQELLASNHLDWVSENTFISKCTVHTIQEYQALRETNELTDYFWRIEYFPHARQFKPDRVEVYCTCEMPYNPDSFMAECSTCKEWYHPACVKTTEAEMSASPAWRCPQCLGDSSSVVRVSHSFVPAAVGGSVLASVDTADDSRATTFVPACP